VGRTGMGAAFVRGRPEGGQDIGKGRRDRKRYVEEGGRAKVGRLEGSGLGNGRGREVRGGGGWAAKMMGSRMQRTSVKADVTRDRRAAEGNRRWGGRGKARTGREGWRSSDAVAEGKGGEQSRSDEGRRRGNGASQ
jgi:hypothetical protein